MRKKISKFQKGTDPELEPDINLALRELAGWPLHSHQQAGHRHRHRTLIVQRDALGRITGSIEQLDEDEYEQYSDSWGK